MGELIGSYQGKKGKPQQIRSHNKENWGVPSTGRRQKTYWCDFDRKEKTVMRKELMIKTPKCFIKGHKYSSAFHNRHLVAHDNCLE